MVPNINPVSTVVYSAQGTDVDNVIIDGKFVVKNSKVLTMDEQAIMDKAKKIIMQVLDKTEIDNKSKWPVV